MGDSKKERLEIGEWTSRMVGPLEYENIKILTTLNNELNELEMILSKANYGINHTNAQGKIGNIYKYKGILEGYINSLPNDMERLIDEPFRGKVDNLMDYLCTIDATKIRTDNTIGRDVTYQYNYLTLENFVGSNHHMDEKAPQYNGGVPKKREYVDEYTKLFKAIYRQQYKDQANLPGGFSEQDFLNTLVIEESVHKKQVGFFKDLLEKVSQITIVVPVIEGILERELGTGDRLTSGEAKGKLIDGGIQAVTLGYGVLTSAGKEVLLDIARSAGSDIAETTVATTLKHAGVNEDISEGIGILTRMKVDKLLTGQSGIRNVEEAFDHVHIKGKTPIDMSKLNKSTVYKLEKRGLTMAEGLDKIGTGGFTNPKGTVVTLQESISKSGTNLSDEMARYDDYWKKVKTGETGHPGMSHEEYVKWGYSDSKVRGQLAFDRVNLDEYFKLKGAEKTKVDRFLEGAKRPVSYKRPSRFRKGVRDKVWDNAKNSNGDVIDPLTGKVMDKSEPWDMGHKPGFEFRKHKQSAEERGIPRKQFLDEYNNPDHYRPELPSSNRSHKGEDLTDNYFGD